MTDNNLDFNDFLYGSGEDQDVNNDVTKEQTKWHYRHTMLCQECFHCVCSL